MSNPVGHLSLKDAVVVIVAYLRGSGENLAAFHALVDLLVHVRDWVSPDPQPMFATTAAHATDAELADQLEAAVPAPVGHATAAAVPWDLILALAMEVMKRWWERRRS
jgi:hypothetical protein